MPFRKFAEVLFFHGLTYYRIFARTTCLGRREYGSSAESTMEPAPCASSGAHTPGLLLFNFSSLSDVDFLAS